MNCDSANQNGITLFHIDGTYNITKKGFPLLIFGRSNPNRKIFPIVAGLCSSEEQVDFEHFFNSILMISRFFGINLIVKFLMQDAQSTCSATARECFPGVTILMCWCHLKQAVKKNITKPIESFKPKIEQDIKRMHYSTTIEQFNIAQELILNSWNSIQQLQDFVTYFTNQWLKSQWKNWKLFTRSYGFSTTNNNTEGFNRIIKLIYTNYERSTILNACKTLEKMLTDLSKSPESFVPKLVRDNWLIKLADFLTLNDFVLTSQTTANRVINGQIKYSVSVNPKFCKCPYFLEYGICKHFISLCKLLNLQFDENDREFVQYFSYEYVTNIEIYDTYLDDFPAVSICNLNPFDTNDPEVLHYLNQTLIRNNFSALIEPTEQSPAIYQVQQAMKLLKANFINKIKGKNRSHSNDTPKFVYTYDKMVISCFFNGEKCDTKDFDVNKNFNYAYCLTFNKKNNSKPLKKTSKTGPGSGLSLEVFSGYPGKQDFLMEKRGVYLAVHNNSVLPSINFEGIKLSVGKMAEIGIKRTFNYKLDEPFTKCRKNTSAYFDNDSEIYKLTLKSGAYRRKTCFEICLQKKLIVPKCKCSDPQIPSYDLNANLCKSYEELVCIEQIRDIFDSQDLSLMCGDHCPISCDTIDYDYLVSYSDYPSEYYYNVIKKQSNVENRFRNYGDLNYSIFKQSTLMLNVFYQELSSTVIKQSPKTSFPNLISKIGGVLGLFFGCSLLTLLEPVGFFISIVYKLKIEKNQTGSV
ncbi:amiloride-sensitive sodium channel subunit gamma [Brachionus plicatilis]|uniref:Amiloride-sensitive sodium channel subunit gamma n=1 Tax=Brachionus plicatilis TaxID=10195 RepID=A0A3M7QYB7_BRAPC|nr:amiloride-sensitive sodium channel subunit gamma [Brachionus plicatilis]